MTLKKLVLVMSFFMCQCICAQNDSIVRLEEVRVSDMQLRKFSNSQSVLQLNDSIVRKNQASLTGLLNYNSVVYFKENGLGMVSSPSFRGTTAQQTAVIWNGININSVFNGQTDFNTISTKDFSSITVRAGGGSTVYGSSAIGGTIHLNNDFGFGKTFENTLQLRYGSFNTANVNYRMQVANERFSSQISISRNSSDNDYPYLDTDMKNENGQYHNTSFNANLGYKIDARNTLKFYSYLFDGERHFSGTLAAPSKSKYEDLNTRNLLEWTGIYNKFTSKLKAAYLTEKYRYFENAATSLFNTANAKTLIAKYDLGYKMKPNLEWNAIIDFTQTKGVGEEIGINTRQVGSGILLLKHSPFKKFLYEVSVRKELTNSYKSPVLYSLGTHYQLADCYQLKLNGSRNFRIPTFNDLYWQGSGNTGLKPESSYQVELGNEFKFKNIGFSITGYYIKIRDLLRWTPGTNGNWTPSNVANVSTYGVEVLANASKKLGKSQLNLNAAYAYTISRDDEKQKQLVYVPYHKF
ncbi:MAG: TonB-dependent receptor, partial [Flavobacterium sp.]